METVALIIAAVAVAALAMIGIAAGVMVVVVLARLDTWLRFRPDAPERRTSAGARDDPAARVAAVIARAHIHQPRLSRVRPRRLR